MLSASLLLAALAMIPQARGRWIERSFGEADAQMRYRLYLPERHDGATALPLVVMLHGCTQTAEDFAAGTRLHALAESQGFLLAFPEQRSDAHPQRCWNWYDPAHQRRGEGEPARIAGITREILRDFAADPDRVYIGGISAGGAMSVNVAAAYPDLFAAVGVHSGVAYAAASDVTQALRVMREGSPEPASGADALHRAMGDGARVVPLFALTGSADAVVAPLNTAALVSQWTRVIARVLETEPPLRPEQRRGEVGGRGYTRTVLRRGPADPPLVESWIVEGLGHAWSGGSPEGSFTDATGPDAGREMVRFFLQHSRSGSGR